MSRMTFAAALSAGFFLVSCASSDGYTPASRTGAPGFSSQQIEYNRYRVTYTGREGQSAQEVRDLALLRAADLTLEQGGDWFQVFAPATSEETSTRADYQAGGFQTDTAYVRDCGLLGCTTRAAPVTRYEPGRFEEDVTTRFEHSMEILIGQGLKPLEANAYDAHQTAANLRR